MANNVEERVVEMRFENDKFEKNAKESISTLQKLKQALNLDGASKGLDSVKKAANTFSIDNMVSNISNGIDQINSRYSILGRVVQNVKEEVASALTSMASQTLNTVSSLSGITQTVQEISSAVGLVTRSINEMSAAANMSAGWDKYAQKTSAVQTIMNATGKSIDEVEAQLSELMWFSDETSYSFTDMTDNVGKFTSQNIDLETSVKAMMGIADAAALAGANSTEASRAMYNISQAMGKGYMQLIDWKSIENANMATTTLKQSLIDAAVEAGTLVQKGEDLYNIAGDVDKEVSVSNFTEYMKEGWMNTEVMLDAFQDYSAYAEVVYQKATEEGLTCAEAMEVLGDGYDELGVKAFKAAQEAKTFADMVDATKDAVSSQWSRVFQAMFGNYEEAKEVWTWWANRFYEVFADPLWDLADMFEEWHQNGGYQMAIDAIISGWYGVKEIVGEVKDMWHDVFPETTAADLLIQTEKIKSTLEGFLDSVNTFFHPKESTIDAMGWYTDELRESAALANKAFGGDIKKASLSRITDWIKENYTLLDEMARVDFFGDTDAAASALASQWAKEWQEAYSAAEKKAEAGEKRVESLQNLFKGIGSAVDIVKQAIEAVNEVLLQPLLGKVPDALTWILNKLGNLGSKITEIAENLRKNNTFKKFLQPIAEWIKKAASSISDFVKRVSNLKSFQKFVGYMKDFGTWLKKLPLNIFDRITGFFSDLKKETGGITMDDAVGAFDWFIQQLNKGIEWIIANWPTAVKWIDGLADSISTAAGAAVDFFTGPDWQAALDFIHDIFGQGWDGLTNSLQTIGDWFTDFIGNKIKTGELTETGKKMGEQIYNGFVEFFGEVDWLEALKKLVTTGFLVKIADSLIGIFDGLKDASKELKNVPKSLIRVLDSLKGVINGYKHDLNASAMLKVTAAIAIMVAAVWALAILPEAYLSRAVAAVTIIGLVLAAIVAAFAKLNAAKAQKKIAEAKSLYDVLSDFGEYLGVGIKRLLSRLGTAMVIKSIGSLFLKIAIAVAVVVAAISILADQMKENGDNIKAASEMLGGWMIAIAAIITILMLLAKLFAEGDWVGLQLSIDAIGKAFFKIAASLLVVTLALAIMSQLSKGRDLYGNMVALGAFLTVMTVCMGIMMGLESFTAGSTLDSVGNTFIKMAASILIIAAALKMLEQCNPNKLAVAAQSLQTIALIIGIVAVAMESIALWSAYNGVASASALTTMSVSIIAMAAAIYIIAAAVNLMGQSAYTLENTVVVILGFVAALAALVGAAAIISKAHLVDGIEALALLFAAMGISVLAAGVGVYVLAAGIGLLAENAQNVPAAFEAIANGIVKFGEVMREHSKEVLQFYACLAMIIAVAVAVGWALSKIGTIISSITSMLGPMLNTIAEHLPKFKTVLIAGIALIIVGIVEYLTGSLSTLVDTIVKLLLQLINSIALAIANNANAFGQALGNILNALMVLLIDGIKGLFESFGVPKEFLDGLLDGLTVTRVEDVKKSIQGSIDELDTGINENVTELRKNVSENILGIGDDITNSANAAASNADMSALTSKTKSNASDDLTSKWAAQGKKINKTNTSAVTEVSEDTGEDSGNAFTSSLDNVLGSGVVSELAGKYGLNFGKDFDLSSIEGLDSSEFTDKISEMGVDGGEAGITGLVEGTDATAYIHKLMGVSEDGAGALNSYSDDYQASGEGNVDAAATGITDEGPVAVNAAGDVGELSADAMEDYEGGKLSGKQTANGFIAGIRSKMQEVYDVCVEMIKKAKAGMEDEAEMHSPSRVAYRYGGYFMQGFINGIDKLSDYAATASGEATNGALEAMNAAIQGSQNLLSDSDLSPTIKPVVDLTDVSSGFESMNGMFSGYQPQLSYNGIGNIPNLGSLSAAFASNAYQDTNVVTAIKSLQDDVAYLGSEMGKMQVVLDSGALVGATTRQMDYSLGRVVSYKSRGN